MLTLIETSEKVARFEAAFNQIHVKLKELVKDPRPHVSFSDALNAGKKLHNVVRYNYDKLRQFSTLRNAIVHNKIREDYYIAEPHEEIVEEIERISDMLLAPPLALSIASQPVTVYTTDTPIKEILSKIDENGYSQFPIYDHEGFQGLLTEGGIAKWISSHLNGNVLSIDGITAKDILPLEKNHNVEFVGRGSTIFDLEAILEDSFDRNEKLEAVLITESGHLIQKPIGIVTSWDLVRIDHTTITLATQV